ncbi:MAG: type I-E CRISPR-associated protein Cse1/CasA [Armatimonadota bacterium]|nr:type I-E CRISPR-associated protein Cse1/CasA [Armatimonadota bacterium]
MPSFDLLNQEWIPVTYAGGRGHVGIREALLRAHELERIGPASPLAEAALHRLLLAVLHRALSGPAAPDAILDLHKVGRFPRDALDSYFQRWAGRFDLFSATTPFYQVPDLPDHEPSPWTKLLPELASGNNPTLFDHTFDEHPPSASPVEAVVALLVHQAFAPGGLIKRLGVTSGPAAPVAGAALFIPQGTTLFETLLLNLVPYEPEGDEPIWERDPYRTADVAGGLARKILSGRTRTYTWLSRAVRLLPEVDGTVRFMGYGPGVIHEPGPDLDPMCAYRRSDNGLQPYTLSVERAFWRDFEAILPAHATWRQPATVDHARRFLRQTDRAALLFPLTVVGQITRQAKVEDVRREAYPLSARALEPDEAARIQEALKLAAEIGNVLGRTGRILAAGLAAPGEVFEVTRSLPLQSTYWSELEVEFPRFLRQLTLDGARVALQRWKDAVSEAVHQAWGLTVRAIGAGARHLRAISEAERWLQTELRRLLL